MESYIISEEITKVFTDIKSENELFFECLNYLTVNGWSFELAKGKCIIVKWFQREPLGTQWSEGNVSESFDVKQAVFDATTWAINWEADEKNIIKNSMLISEVD